MTTTIEPQRSPRDIFLTVPEVFERYRWKRSRGYLMLDEPGFPPRIGNGYRLDTLHAWEDSLLANRNTEPAAAAVEAEPEPEVPAVARRAPRTAPAPVALPAKKRAGRKAA